MTSCRHRAHFSNHGRSPRAPRCRQRPLRPGRGRALTALEPLGVDAIGLNCATGPDEMSEHLRHLSKQSSVAIACMPNSGLPILYTDRSSPKSLVEAIAGLTDEQRGRYLNPPCTIGSAMFWPVRSKDQPTMNQARGFGPSGRLIGDRMDLTLECIRRHYSTGEPESPPPVSSRTRTRTSSRSSMPTRTFRAVRRVQGVRGLLSPARPRDARLWRGSVLPALGKLRAFRDTSHDRGVRDVPRGHAGVHRSTEPSDGQVGHREPPRHRGSRVAP